MTKSQKCQPIDFFGKNASGYGVHWPLPWGRGAIITHRAFNRERIGKEHWYLKVVFRRMSVIQTKQGIFDISQHIQRFIWRYTGLVFIPLLQMCACFQGKRITSACLASPKQVKLKKTIIKLMTTLYCRTSACSLIFSSLSVLWDSPVSVETNRG